MHLNWLFGAETESTIATRESHWQIFLRSYVLDVDALLELNEIANRYSGTPQFHIQTQGMPDRTVPVDELRGLSAADRGRLFMTISAPPNPETNTITTSASVELRTGVRPCVSRSGNYWFDIEDHLARVIRDGRPRIRWANLLPPLPLIAWTALLAVWIWLAITTPPSAVHIFGALVVGFLFFTALSLSRQLSVFANKKYPGHRIRDEARSETYARRADRHANLKVALITAPVTIAVTVIVAWLVFILNLND